MAMGAHSIEKIYVILVTSSILATLLASPATRDLRRREDDVKPEEGVPVTDAEKKFIVDTHNKLRKTVYPKAKEMKAIAWSEELAKYAQEWARCDTWFLHRTGPNRVLLVGENLESVTASFPLTNCTRQIESALCRWWNEKENYEYENNQCTLYEMCGHYTQMAWWSATEVGCAYAHNCHLSENVNPYNFYLVCYYRPTGNIQGYKPYNKPDVNTEQTNRIRTFGGNGKGSYCAFPFTSHGQEYNQCTKLDSGDSDWCRTENGGWGYCYNEWDSGAEACADTVLCSPYKMFLNGCKGLSSVIKETCCGSSCFTCECLTDRWCENGGERNGQCGCTCPANTGWTGATCGFCALNKNGCNGGVFNDIECRCEQCPKGRAGFDCSCMDITGNLPNLHIPGLDRDVDCEAIANGDKLCQCPDFKTAASKYCPQTCGTCPTVDDIYRGMRADICETREEVSKQKRSTTGTAPAGPCAANPCKHGGKCTETNLLLNEYICNCTQDWRGQNCRLSRKLPPLAKVDARVVNGQIEVQLEPRECNPDKELSCQRLFQVRLQTIENDMIVSTRILDSDGTSIKIDKVQSGTKYRVSGCIRMLTENGEDAVGPWCPPTTVTIP